ncbi:hypothetical protein [Cardinium endosymbiont of Bemisia tabaci]|uniref:hypothetical protein n=1 Tax=Cardinium endosymbiont of Bemisia tabaci TaxID=672794 RepID=UPI000442D305|nr:hypothetical protein [Cardinium endosymbiont of Bemisia tabaci]CDG49389.1 Hypothetical protein CHV_a0061 [Cardinium endosymbiont cBtQ1 of Bemisia tabaci]
MKIKIALLGLFFANNIVHPIYADPLEHRLEVDKTNTPLIIEQDHVKVKESQEEEAKSEHLIKLGAAITMEPAVVYQNKKWSPKNSISANLTFKAEVPNAWCNQTAIFNIAAACKEDNTKLSSATVTIGKMTTIGCASTILSYEKADGALLISPGKNVLQIKNQHTFDWFRIGYAIEKPIALQIGLFDKTQPEKEKSTSKEKEEKKEEGNGKKEKEEKKGKGPIQLDNLEDKERPFKIKNGLPSFGLNLSVVTDDLNISLSGLGRFTDYTHSTDPNAKNLPNKLAVTYGGHLGVQYQVVPKKFTITGQGAYVHGLGDYLPGLAGIQSDDERKEMCAAYYVDKDKDKLSFINAWGFGAALTCCVTPKWTLSIRGSYLTTPEDSEKPASAFRNKWNLVPNLAYAFNKYFTFSGGYNVEEEYKVDNKKNKGAVHKFSGSIKFSL